MKTANIPTVKLGVVAVSRDCFPIALSTDRKNRVCGELANQGWMPITVRLRLKMKRYGKGA